MGNYRGLNIVTQKILGFLYKSLKIIGRPIGLKLGVGLSKPGESAPTPMD